MDPSALLSLLTTGKSVGESSTPTTTPDTLTASAGPVDALRQMPAVPANPTSAVSSAPTFAGTGPMGAAKGHAERGMADPAYFAGERRSGAEKLAADAAFSAASAAPGTLATSREPVEGEFRAVMERATNNPANILIQNSGAAAPATPAPGLRLDTPLGQAGWHDEMGQKLTWMVNNHRQQAELVLNPPQLGRIEVTLTLDGDQASVSFASPHAAVRETLENSMMRLREVLAEAGVTLGQSHVGAESRNNPNSMHWRGDGLASGSTDGEPQNGAPSAQNSGLAGRSGFGRGMVDIFA